RFGSCFRAATASDHEQRENHECRSQDGASCGHDFLLVETDAAAPPLRARRGGLPCSYFAIAGSGCFFGAVEPGPQAPAPAVAIACACSLALSRAWSMLKLAGFWRGGNSANVFKNSPTIACAGTIVNIRSAIHF